MFVSIRSHIAKFARRPEVSQKLEEEKVKNDWQDIIESINKSARGKSQALYVSSRGELVVRVKDHLWLQEFSFYKEDIRKAVSKRASIKDIRLIT